MPVRVDKISVGFEPYTETTNAVTRKCCRCKQVKNIDCFKRCYCTSKHAYFFIYTLTCSECLDMSVQQTVVQ